MKKNVINSWASTCCYACSVVFYLLAINSLVADSFGSETIVYLCLGAAFCGLGATRAFAAKKKK